MTFHMWSIGHYLFLISPFLVAFMFHVIFKHKTYEEKRKIGIITSIIMILLLLGRNIEIFVRRDFGWDHELVPLQICHFANFVLLYAFAKDSKPVFGFALLFNLPMAFLSILFADGLENYDTIITFRGIAYIFGHMLIVSTTIWAYTEKFAVLDRKVYENTILIAFVLFVLSIFENNLFRVSGLGNANFFYTYKPEKGTPIEMIFNWGQNVVIGDRFMINPIYIVGMLFLGLLIISLMYAIFKGVEFAYRKNESHQKSIVTAS